MREALLRLRGTGAGAGKCIVISTHIMQEVQRLADRVVLVAHGRTLAEGTVAELCAAGVGSILIPFPGAVDDHQARNAQYLKECGAGNWLRQTETLEHDLQQLLGEFCADRNFLLQLAIAARKASLPDATNDVADIVLSEAQA